MLRYPFVITIKAAVSGNLIAGVTEACQQGAISKGEAEGLLEVRGSLGQEIDNDIKFNLISIAGTGKAKLEVKKDARNLVASSSFDVEAEILGLEIAFFQLRSTGITLKLPKTPFGPFELYRAANVFPE